MIRPLRFLLTIAFGVLLVGVVLVAAKSYDAASENRVLYRYLSQALAEGQARQTFVEWKAASEPTVRPVGVWDRQRIGVALTEAWAAHSAASATGATHILPDHFSGVALDRATRSARMAAGQGTHMAILAQVARPTFYHLDGSVFQAQVDALTVRYAQDGDRIAEFRLSEDVFLTTLMNETNGWRVYSHEQQQTAPTRVSGAPTLPGRLAGINYYPAHTPWRAFWPEFDEQVISRDFARTAGLGANAVRVFLHRDAFTDPAAKTGNLQKLKVMLDLAQAHGLSVIPTLFDQKYSYQTANWAEDVAYLGAVLDVLRGNPSVAFIDLKNEPDLDFGGHGRALVTAWLRSMAAVTRMKAPELALTVGWSSVEFAGEMIDDLDIVSYHDYAPLDGTVERLARVRLIADGKPVMVTEIGESSWGAAAGYPGSTTKQADTLGVRLNDLTGADGIFVWTLNDFPDPDPQAVGSKPWVRGMQSSFGLYSAEGNAKPAAEVVRSGFDRFLD